MKRSRSHSCDKQPEKKHRTDDDLLRYKLIPLEVWVHVIGYVDRVYYPALRKTCRLLYDSVFVVTGRRCQIPIRSIVTIPLPYFQWLYSGMELYDNKTERGICNALAFLGCLDMLKYVQEKCDFIEMRIIDICNNAAEGGHINILEWAKSQFSNPRWNENTCSGAAEGGHLNVLQWLRSQEPPCPWNSDTCKNAAKRGHLDILQWAHANGCDWDSDVCLMAASYGHCDIFEWARSQNPPCPWDESEIYEEVITYGDLNMLRCIVDNGLTWYGTDACSLAAYSGDMGKLQWAHNNGFPWDENTCSDAALAGELEILQWVRDNGCPWNEETCSSAASMGHLNILQWARANGCPWNETTSYDAYIGGNKDVLEWAISEGCPIDIEVRSFASNRGYEDVLQCIREIDSFCA